MKESEVVLDFVSRFSWIPGGFAVAIHVKLVLHSWYPDMM